MIRSVAATLSVVGAVSFGFNLPAHAQNQSQKRKPAQASPEMQKLQEKQAELKAEFAKDEYKDVKVYDGQGQPTTFDKILSDGKAFQESFAIDLGPHRIRIRGEMLDSGKKGVLLIATREVNGQAVNGQVMTLKPGLSKNEIKSRFGDLVLSLTTDLSTNAKKTDSTRGVASFTEDFAQCGMGVIASLFLGSLLAALVDATVDSRNTRAGMIAAGAASVAIGLVGLFSTGGTVKACGAALLGTNKVRF